MSSMTRTIRRSMEREQFMSAKRVNCPKCGKELKGGIGGRYRKCENCGNRWRIAGKKGKR